MHGWDEGWFWAWMAPMIVVWLVLAGVVVWGVVRLVLRAEGPQGEASERSPAAREDPRAILDRRLALGEIDPAEYTRLRETLARHDADRWRP